MHELPRVTILWSRVVWFANYSHDWRNHEWKYLANHLTSDQKSLFTATNVLFYFLHAILYLEHTPFRYKQSSIAHFVTVARDGLFWLNIVTSSQLICDVMRTRGTGIVPSYSLIVLCTRKLAQKQSSPVNNNRECRFLITRYSRFSV